MRKLWESQKNVISKSWESCDKIMRKLWECHEDFRPFVRSSRSGDPPCILKRGGPESSGQRLISLNGKAMIIAFISVFKTRGTKIGPNTYLTPYCDLLNMIFFDFLDWPQKYHANNTFGTSLAFQMRVLERLEQVNICKILRFWPTLISGWWKPNLIVVHTFIYIYTN